MLFFDPRLSGAQNMSCSSCHNPSFGWETPVSLAIGALNAPLKRHAPTVENLAEADSFFWDGRAESLEVQAVGPITHPKEMNADLDEVINRLSAIEEYRRYFRIAYPSEGLTVDTMLRSIATYERTLRSGWSRFDDWVSGDEDAISAPAKRGFEVFIGPARCASCHSGWSFTDHAYHAIGVASGDVGRGGFDPSAPYQFKTPGLRNIALRAPFMHNGSVASLRQVVEHYRVGGAENYRHIADIEPLDLSQQQVEDLITFLHTLTALDPHVSAPALPAE